MRAALRGTKFENAHMIGISACVGGEKVAAVGGSASPTAQAAGAFFFVGLLLNFAGFGYTIDMEHGLVIDKMQNIRNTVQFEMEIQREEREDVMMKAGSSSSGSSGAVGSTKLLESSFRDYSEQ